MIFNEKRPLLTIVKGPLQTATDKVIDIPRYPCCGMVVGPGEGKGCTSTHPCCGAAQVDSDDINDVDKKATSQGQGAGCKEVCRKCQQPWGSPALQVAVVLRC